MGASVSHDDVPVWFGLVLQFSSWEQRLNMRYLNRAFAKYYDLEYPQRILVEALAKEFQVFVPRSLPHGYTWRRLFRELFIHRDIWSEIPTKYAPAQMKHRIKVFSRFKPMPRNLHSIEQSDQKIVLPLHQRLSLIKLSNGLSSNREAIQILMNEGSWFRGTVGLGKENNLSEDSSKIDPKMAKTPNTKDLVASVHSVDPATGKVVLITPDVGLREFSFDSVFPANIGQKSVYQTVTAGVIMDFMNGDGFQIIYVKYF